MTSYEATLEFHTEGSIDVVDITQEIQRELGTSGVSYGLCCLFVPGSTAAITTIEAEQGAINDLKRAIERAAPENIEYEHDLRWGDGNGFSHVRAALLGPSLTIPIVDGRLTLGTWQQIVLVELDIRPRSRRVAVSIMGEE